MVSHLQKMWNLTKISRFLFQVTFCIKNISHQTFGEPSSRKTVVINLLLLSLKFDKNSYYSQLNFALQHSKSYIYLGINLINTVVSLKSKSCSYLGVILKLTLVKKTKRFQVDILPSTTRLFINVSVNLLLIWLVILVNSNGGDH